MQTGVTSVTINISGLSALHPDVVLIGHDRWLENSSQLPMTSQRFVSKGLTRTGWFPVGNLYFRFWFVSHIMISKRA